MNIRISGMIAVIALFFVSNAVAQTMQGTFFPTLFWGNNVDLGVMLTKPNEMLIVDSKGNKHEKVLATEAVSSVYISPNGQKLVYTTGTGIWLVALGTGQTQLVTSGDCYSLYWSADSLSFLFTVWETRKEEVSATSRFKLLWAAGDGKNLKQVYP
ncbi:MAG: hypothetical protein HY796_03335 [Elusimicrobia bacterium]|nr:hypothetical protein [Elusimicrobiota bacterium]